MISSLGGIGPVTSLSGSVKPKTGLVTVTFENGGTKTTGHGAILLNTLNGGGYFQTATTAGTIKLEGP